MNRDLPLSLSFFAGAETSHRTKKKKKKREKSKEEHPGKQEKREEEDAIFVSFSVP